MCDCNTLDIRVDDKIGCIKFNLDNQQHVIGMHALCMYYAVHVLERRRCILRSLNSRVHIHIIMFARAKYLKQWIWVWVQYTNSIHDGARKLKYFLHWLWVKAKIPWIALALAVTGLRRALLCKYLSQLSAFIHNRASYCPLNLNSMQRRGRRGTTTSRCCNSRRSTTTAAAPPPPPAQAPPPPAQAPPSLAEAQAQAQAPPPGQAPPPTASGPPQPQPVPVLSWRGQGRGRGRGSWRGRGRSGWRGR